MRDCQHSNPEIDAWTDRCLLREIHANFKRDLRLLLPFANKKSGRDFISGGRLDELACTNVNDLLRRFPCLYPQDVFPRIGPAGGTLGLQVRGVRRSWCPTFQHQE